MIPQDILKEVILSQRSSLEKRDLGVAREEKISLTENFAVVITGIRRCGKSTLLNQLLKKQKKGYYLNLEDPRLENFDISDFNKIEPIMVECYGDGGTYFFDEVQNVDKWEKFIRYLVDKKEKVVVTGSNASLLSSEFGTKLTGRYLKTTLFPFSFNEFASIRKGQPSIKLFEEYLFTGGFPEFVKTKNPEILHELLSDVVLKDIAVRFGIRNHVVLNRLAIYLITNAGKEFSYNSLKKLFGIKSVQSVIDYIDYFENAYLFFTVPRFDYSYKKQLISPKKVYTIDNGFSCNNSASFSKDLGRMLENAVFLNLRRAYSEILYFQEKNECDFLVKEREKIVLAMQVCYTFEEGNMQREIDGLMAALKKFDLKEGLIITYNQEDNFVVEGRKIKVIPAWKWMADKL